ncbi:hypothetical protein [Thorsellia anophelis]|uniref:Uncharacterized protein n=1 Tax=Thorsellia anophelis DSM 18579 TaxID=1123402 RepID=A0A1I0AAP1_9GAMM|nr:hypothetical protein [Thorsellia anophelis]SES90326.1 hypothetical protein SAMN02583745_00830 [Thorsellia anophelis DSM 18579]
MLLKSIKIKSGIFTCFLFNVGSLLAAPILDENLNATNNDDLAQISVINTPISISSPSAVFQTQNDIEGIFNVLQNLEFEQVPEASLMAQLAEEKPNVPKKKARSQTQASNTQIVRESSNSNSETSAKVLDLQREISELKKENEQLNRELSSVKQPTNQMLLNNIASNVLKDFSKEQAAKNAQVVQELEMRIDIAEQEMQKKDLEIKKLNALPLDADKKLIKQLEAVEIKNKDIEQKYSELESQFLNERKLLEAELENKKNQLTEAQTALEQFKNETTRNQAIAEKLSNQLATTENPLNDKIEALTHETLVLKKAYQDEKQRAEDAIRMLNELQAQSKTQLTALQQQNQNVNQGQAQQLLQLQQRAQLAELNTQKLQQKLQISENKTIELEETISKLNAQITKNTQSYQLQLTDLQQRLLNARRAEQEANRWARAAGSGNTNAASNRIINLQQQIDQIAAAEETQRVIAMQKQQEVINLQNQLYSIQAELKTQQQSRAQLENQLQDFEMQKKESNEAQSTTNKVEEAASAVNNSEPKKNDSSKKKPSTDAGIKGL